MRNSKLIKEATKSVFEELFALSSEEFHAMLEDDSELGPTGAWLCETGAVETIWGGPVASTYIVHLGKSVTESLAFTSKIQYYTHQSSSQSYREYYPGMPSDAADNYKTSDWELEWPEAA